MKGKIVSLAMGVGVCIGALLPFGAIVLMAVGIAELDLGRSGWWAVAVVPGGIICAVIVGWLFYVCFKLGEDIAKDRGWV